MKRMTIMKQMVMVICIACIAPAAMGAMEEVLFSDNFNRADGSDLGTTAEGYAWNRWDVTSDGKVGGPQIVSNQLQFKNDDSQDYVFVDSTNAMASDFQMDLDYTRTDKWSDTGYTVSAYFRTQRYGYIPGGGQVGGYGLGLSFEGDSTGKTLKVALSDDYGTLVTDTVTLSQAWQCHVTLVAEGSNITVSIDGVEEIDHDTTGSSNPAADGTDSSYGYFGITGNRTRNQAFDNLVVMVPEPSSLVLLGVGSWFVVAKWWRAKKMN